jgi:ABC-type multidrug transport system ATPase subunit
LISGGNKRKVNAAIAFLGKPSVVILDGNLIIN